MSSASKILLSANNLKHTDPGRPNHVYELNPAAAKYWFDLDSADCERPRLARYGVHGDGSCAYHSICTALNVEDYVHQNDERQKQIAYKFRCSFADKLTQDGLRAIVKKCKSKSPVRLTEVQEALCDPKVWADETTIRFMAETLDMNLIFLDMTKNNVYCGMHHDKAMGGSTEDWLSAGAISRMPPTIVAQILHEGPRVTELRIVFDPAHNPNDELLIRALMSKYKMQCSPKRKKNSNP